MNEKQLLIAEIGKAKASSNRQIWFIATIFLILNLIIITCALLYVPVDTVKSIQQLSPTKIPQTDFLKLSIPVAILFFGFAVSFLGIKRLEQFDSEINQIRTYLSNQLLEERKITLQEREKFGEELTRNINEIKETIKTISENYVSESIDNRKESIEKYLAEFTKNTDIAIDNINTMLLPYKWLEQKKEEVDFLVNIRTAGIAKERVEQFNSENKKDISLKIAEYVVQQKLSGDPTDFHNLSADVAINENKPLAADIIDLGLSFFPHDINLLADGIKYHSESGNFTRAGELYFLIQEIEFSRWNWRLFVFVGDYLELIGKIKDAMEIYEQYKQYLPLDERAYSQPALYFKKSGKYHEAIEILEKCLQVCPKCEQAAFVLSDCYLKRGEYENVLTATDRSLESSADEQPSVNQSSIIWNKALALDAITHRNISKYKALSTLENHKDELIAKAKKCITYYNLCLSMDDCISVFKIRGPERIKILKGIMEANNLSDEEIDSMADKIKSPMDMINSLEDLSKLKELFDDDSHEQ